MYQERQMPAQTRLLLSAERLQFASRWVSALHRLTHWSSQHRLMLQQLQNYWQAAHRDRGGFDSNAFPTAR